MIITLAANIVLAALIVSSIQKVNSPVTSEKPQPANQSVKLTLREATPEPNKTYTLSANLWRELDPDDLWTLAKRLRAAGFPAKAVRQMIWDLNSARGEIARAAIQGKSEETPYWKTTPYFPDDPALRAKIREINQQGSKVYMKLMVDPDMLAEDDNTAFFVKSHFGDLPIAKLQKTAKVWVDYMELRDAIYESTRKRGVENTLTPADREKLALLASEEQYDLKQTLSPEEYAEYQFRSSPTAERLRDQLEVFRPTEQEYKTIFELQRSVDEQFKLTSDSDPQNRQAYDDAMKTLGPQLQAALGQERYADYLQAMDQTNNKLKRLVARLDLPLATVGKIIEVQTDISQRAEAIRKDQTLSPADQAERITQLTQEAQTKLTNTLGARGFTAYEENKGSWLRALTESASKTSP